MRSPRLPVKHWLRAAMLLATDRRGATAVEYGFIVALIVLAMFAALKELAGTTVNMWGNVSTRVATAPGS